FHGSCCDSYGGERGSQLLYGEDKHAWNGVVADVSAPSGLPRTGCRKSDLPRCPISQGTYPPLLLTFRGCGMLAHCGLMETELPQFNHT
ncbi:hypothetical protein GOODEAATRI_015715, partial [Goodea atripinnis]